MSEPFITRPLSIVLDLLRFVCAFVVLLVHASGGISLYDGPPLLSGRASHVSVIIFFVLSGLVIAAAIAERQTDLKSYAIARFARIMSVAVPAIALCCALQIVVSLPTGGMAPGQLTDLALAALRDITFLSQSGLGPGVPVNGAYWSLCYEVWYYALFGAAVFLKGKTRWTILALLALLAGWRILLLMPIWLAGAYLNRSSWARSLSPVRGVIVLLCCLVAFLWVASWDIGVMLALREALPFSLGMSELFVSDFAIGAITVAAIAALRPLAGIWSAGLERLAGPIKYAAGFSYTLYLFQFPLLATLTQFGVTVGDSLPGLFAILALVVAVSAGIAELTERRSPALRRWLAHHTAAMRQPLARLPA